MKAFELLAEMQYADEIAGGLLSRQLAEAIAELEALQSRSCSTCKHKDIGRYEICPIREPLSRQWLDYDEETFSCNQWETKDETTN